MSADEKYEELYHELMKYQQKMHVQNQKRIQIGIKCLIFIPLIFLILVFITDSEKVIFLTLWIVSMFIMSGYLIYVEYADFKIQEYIGEISKKEKAENDVLIGKEVENLESSFVQTLKQMEKKKDEKMERMAQKMGDRKEQIMARIEKADVKKLEDLQAKEKEEKNEEHTEDHTK